MSRDNYIPRFSFEITSEQKERADRLLETYGLRRALFSIILDDVLDLIEDYGGVAIGMIISGKIKPRKVLPSLHKVNFMEEKDG